MGTAGQTPPRGRGSGLRALAAPVVCVLALYSLGADPVASPAPPTTTSTATTLKAAAAKFRIEVSVIQTGHSRFVRGTDRLSNHYDARAVDISAVDGTPVSASNAAALDPALAVLGSDASLRPDELGSPWPHLGHFPGAFSDADHLGHLHLGWR